MKRQLLQRAGYSLLLGRQLGAVASACGKAMETNPRFSLPQVLQAAALSLLGGASCLSR